MKKYLPYLFGAPLGGLLGGVLTKSLELAVIGIMGALIIGILIDWIVYVTYKSKA